MSPSNVVNFGLQLNITRNVIKGFEICHNRDMKQCLREILKHRLKREPPLTWPNIVTALRAGCVGESRLAREIEARHMPSSQAPSSGPPEPERAEASLTPHPQTITPSVPIIQPLPIPHPSHQAPYQQQLAHNPYMPQHQYSALSHLPSSQPPPSLPPQQKRAEASLITVPVPPQPSYQSRRSPHPSPQAPYQQQLTYNHPHPQSLYPYHPPYPPHYHPSPQAPHIPPQYHTQPVPSYHPQDNVPQYHQYSHQYPHRLSLVEQATHSGSQVQATAEPPTAKRARSQPPANEATHSGDRPEPYATSRIRLQPPVNEATHSGYHIHYRAEPPVTRRARLIQPPVAQSNTSVSDQTSLFHRFITFVKSNYRHFAVERDPNVLKWPPTPRKVYINLACIDRMKSGLKSVYDEITEAMVRDGNVDVVHGGKFPIDMNEIAKGLPVDTPEKIILVEGAPGVGKSTFAWEYCRRWERGEIAQQYQLVLLLRLRDDRTSRAKTLRDLIYHPMEGVPEAVCKGLLASYGSHVMIILEGFDELPDSGRMEGSVFMQLMSGKILPLATVLVTSRPWATKNISNEYESHIHQHIEILGFTKSQISEYIKSRIPQEKVSELTTYLERHPEIRAGMYIPLNSAIVVTVYQESQDSGCPMPTTLTELYTALVRTLIVRYLRGHPEYAIIDIQRFTDLPPAVYAKFLKLCGVAYNGIVSNSDQVQLVFSERDLPADFDNLGLMDSFTELYVTQGTVSSHNFLHLTFQEFFAAVHISNMSPEQQLEHFQREMKQSGGYGEGRGGFRGGLGEDNGDDRLKVILRFLAGLTKLNCISKDAVNHFIQSPTTREDERNQLSCDAVVDTNLVNCMFEAQSDDVIALLLEQKRIEMKIGSSNMLPMDYYSLGYCIAHSQCQWALRVEEEEKVDEERVKMLAVGASISDGGQGGKIVGLGGTGNEVLTVSYECLNMIFTEWKSILQLHQLSLMLWVPCDEITWPDLSQLRILILAIRSSAMKLDSLLPHLSLESLTINGYEDSTLDCVALEHHLTNTPTLKHISISNFKCNASGLLVLARALHDHPNLHEKELEKVYISRIKGDDEAQDLAQLYNEYPNMVNWTDLVKVTGISDARAVALAQALHHNSALKTLDLSNNSISDAGAVALAQALHHNSTLWKLYLSNNSIGDAGAVALAQTLHHNSTLKTLDLSNNSISDAGAVALAQALHHNSTLKTLDLSNNSISDAGAVALARALQHNSTLKELDLSNNSISDAGAVAIAQALHHNSTLKELDLTGNDGIGEEGARQLIKTLRMNAECKLNLPRRYEEYATPLTTSRISE